MCNIELVKIETILAWKNSNIEFNIKKENIDREKNPPPNNKINLDSCQN